MDKYNFTNDPEVTVCAFMLVLNPGNHSTEFLNATPYKVMKSPSLPMTIIKLFNENGRMIYSACFLFYS